MSTARKETPVRNNPGIYKRYKFDNSSQKWIDTGKYRALRQISENGLSRKEQAVFDNIEDANLFRSGALKKANWGSVFHKEAKSNSKDRYTFASLVSE